MIELPERPRGSAPYFRVTVVLEQTDNQLQRRAVLEAPERPDGSHADRPIRVARQLAQPRNRFGLLGITKSEDRRDFDCSYRGLELTAQLFVQARTCDAPEQAAESRFRSSIWPAVRR